MARTKLDWSIINKKIKERQKTNDEPREIDDSDEPTAKCKNCGLNSTYDVIGDGLMICHTCGLPLAFECD